MTNNTLIAFDFDGVIIDSLDHNLEAVRQACRKIGHERLPTREDIQNLDNMVFAELVRRIGVEEHLVESLTEEVFALLSAARETPPLFPGILEMLQKLSAIFPLAIVTTNTAAQVQTNIRDLQIEDLFQTVKGSDTPGHKSDKLIELCSEFTIKKNNCYMIGDAVSDLVQAQKAGVKAVGVAWGFQPESRLILEKPDFIARSPEDILNYFPVNN